MVATYLSVFSVCAASLVIGQGIVTLCGVGQWSWLSPAVGLAGLCIVCWGTVRLPGEGATSAIVVLALSITAGLGMRGRCPDLAGAAVTGAPVALFTLLAAALPFVAEGRFGILGTSFNPDMSQHLLASVRLAEGTDSPLVLQGYPLGPHSIVVALHDGLGVGLVQGFSGLTVAVAVLSALTALSALNGLSPVRRMIAAFLVGVSYMVASYFAQGAFKETIEALFLLAFVLGLRGLTGSASAPGAPRLMPQGVHGPPERTVIRAAPLAVIAAGSVYAYSFPGLVWLGGAAALWGVLELLLGDSAGGSARVRAALPPAGAALACLLVLIGPEIGRMIDFRNFETFDPAGAGLGNLFGQISPVEALGIWPSGDFRLTPGDGAVPALGYYLGAALALGLVVNGLLWSVRRRETALLAGVVTSLAIYLFARVTGTPYQAAKAVELIAPVAALAIVLPLVSLPLRGSRRSQSPRLVALGGAAFSVAATACVLLALANAPVGPADYSPGLTELRPITATKPTLVLASRDLLNHQHGRPYLSWELRGSRLCIGAAKPRHRALPRGVGFVITANLDKAPYAGLKLDRRSGPYTLWAVRDPSPGPSPCPLIAVRAARSGASPSEIPRPGVRVGRG